MIVAHTKLLITGAYALRRRKRKSGKVTEILDVGKLILKLLAGLRIAGNALPTGVGGFAHEPIHRRRS